MSTPGTVAFHTLGCKLNFSETSSIRRSFESHGFTTVDFEDGADLYVLNTCSVTEFADKKCRYEVRRALKYSPDAKIVVVGCYAQLKPEEIASIPGVDLVLGAGEKFNILNYVDNLVKAPGKGLVKAGEIREVNSFYDAFSFGDRTRSFLKVQDGCDYKCTFCTIPKARGRSRSDSLENVIANARKIAELGVKEIVLTGVNLGDFGNGTEVIEGIRPKKEATFIDLIKALDRVEGIERYRISSIEPNLLTDEIIDFVASSQKFMPHFHIPLQSGSDRILKSMQRRYLRELYRRRVDYIRKVIPDCCIGVDVIVGFPGETETDFTESYEFIKDMDVSYLHVFTYSERSDTPAASMPGRVPMEVRRERNEMLRILSQKKKKQFADRFAGTVRPVLLEKDSNTDSLWSGFTDNYLKIKIKAENREENNIIQVSLGSYDPLTDCVTAVPAEDLVIA
ncbi:MAG: tRNA (N(6)-L-threonylcarbamoyladenosine(37)-C(2))-methylthiotransferase MtaB [Saprospiraceae bacterium]|nr:tRNA (N(6)-L-threonylcarbamoyladenosine(37)-C(2))-methylthiotransferase MtaB [Saprospiraceae bacterium]